jgi:hypothetical protein
MKPLKNFLILLPIVLGSASQRPPETFGNRIVHSNKGNGSQAQLEYIGSMTGKFSYGIGIQVSIDTTIGIRYELTIERQTAVIGHVAIFYKFSSPFQTITYNFIRHESTVNKNDGSPGSDPNVEVIGTETVNSYPCTHLQHGTNAVTDYWMSPKVPGVSMLLNTLKTMNPNLPALVFSGAIYKWGGLVRMTSSFVDPKGKTMSMELHLRDANTDIILPSKTFDVPSK